MVPPDRAHVRAPAAFQQKGQCIRHASSTPQRQFEPGPGELSDAEGKSRFEVATLGDGTAALELGNPEEKRRFGRIAKASGFARFSTPLRRDAPSRGNKDRAA